MSVLFEKQLEKVEAIGEKVDDGPGLNAILRRQAQNRNHADMVLLAAITESLEESVFPEVGESCLGSSCMQWYAFVICCRAMQSTKVSRLSRS